MEFFKRKSSKKKKEKKKQGQKSNEARAKTNDGATGISEANRVVDQPSSSLNTTDTRNMSHGKQGQPNKEKPADAHSTSSGAIKDPNDQINDSNWENIYPSLPKPKEDETAKSVTTGQSSSSQLPDGSSSMSGRQGGATGLSTQHAVSQQGKCVESCPQPVHENQMARSNATYALTSQFCQMNLQGVTAGPQAIHNQTLENETARDEEERQQQEGNDREGERQQEEQQNEEQRDGQERNNQEENRYDGEIERHEEGDSERERQHSQNEEENERQGERNEGERERQQQERQNELEQEENGEHAPVQEQAEAVREPSVSSMLETDAKLLETICLMLLPYHSLIKNWESLSHELGASPALRTQLKRQTNHSQTRELFETLSITKKELKVQELINVASSLKRNDVADLLRTKVPGNPMQNNVVDTVFSDDELMERLETKLDNESKVLKNWYHVGLKLGLSKATLQEIKNGSFRNNIGGFFEYVYARFPTMTVEEFKDIMRHISRNDVVEELSGVPEGPMVETIPLHGDKMHSLCYMLSMNSCGTVNDWKHLAMELNIGYHEYKIYEKEVQEDPTKLLLEWALIDKPNMTITELCEHFKNIKRYDVINEVEKYYGHSFIESQGYC